LLSMALCNPLSPIVDTGMPKCHIPGAEPGKYFNLPLNALITLRNRLSNT
jgi:hypothetical protein